MNSVVCIAQVPETEARIKIAPDSRHIDETDRWAAGVELQPGFADAEAATRWRGFVDSLN